MQKYLQLTVVLSICSLVVATIVETVNEIIDHGYPAEYHSVSTDDGNIVAAIRIPYSHKLQNMNKTRSIVLLQHGIFACSDTWIASGPNDALAYLLADAGFDVWLGNTRGNVYSNELKTPAWNYSWHEIGYYDVPAIIDYALKTNGHGQKSLHYVGHSQGTTTFFVLTSLRPEYNKKIKTAHLLAPVAFMKNICTQCMQVISYICTPGSLINFLLADSQIFEWILSKLMGIFNTWGCDFWSTLDLGGNRNMTAFQFAYRHYPAGGSNNQILHFLFNIQSGLFRQYDYGKSGNIKLYKSETPPVYPVQKVTSLVHLWYSEGDLLTPKPNILTLEMRLSNVFQHRMSDPKWSHLEFVLHKEVRKYINDPLIAIMKEYERKRLRKQKA